MKVLVALVALGGVAAAEPARRPLVGPAIGVEAGEPTSVTAGWFTERVGIAGGIGSGTLYGPGLALHADVLVTPTRVAARFPLVVGLGVRWYDQHYALASADEMPSRNVGLRASVAIAYPMAPLELYAELAPGVDVSRSGSCNLADGPRSICPHAMATPLFVDVVVGARWFLGH